MKYGNCRWCGNIYGKDQRLNASIFCCPECRKQSTYYNAKFGFVGLSKEAIETLLKAEGRDLAEHSQKVQATKKRSKVKETLTARLAELNAKGITYADWQKEQTLKKYGKIDLSV